MDAAFALNLDISREVHSVGEGGYHFVLLFVSCLRGIEGLGVVEASVF